MTPRRILFLHGFASSGRYKMADQLRILLKPAEVLAPDIPAEPEEALRYVREVASEYGPDLVVGHSLGCFWAHQLRGVAKALVNPCFFISEHLRTLPRQMQYLSPREDGQRSFAITDAMCEGFARLEAAQFEGLTPGEILHTIAFFADADETVRQGDVFAARYGKPGISYPGGHLPGFPEMKKYIVPEILKSL